MNESDVTIVFIVVLATFEAAALAIFSIVEVLKIFEMAVDDARTFLFVVNDNSFTEFTNAANIGLSDSVSIPDESTPTASGIVV